MAITDIYDIIDRSGFRAKDGKPLQGDAYFHKALNVLTNNMGTLEDRYRRAGIAWHRLSLNARELPDLSSSAHAGARAARELFEPAAPGSGGGGGRGRDITHGLQEMIEGARQDIRDGHCAGLRRRLGEMKALHAALEDRLDAANGATADGVRLGARYQIRTGDRKAEMEEGVRRWVDTLPGVRRLAGDDKTVTDHVWYHMYYGNPDGFESESEDGYGESVSDIDMTDADMDESDYSDSDSE